MRKPFFAIYFVALAAAALTGCGSVSDSATSDLAISSGTTTASKQTTADGDTSASTETADQTATAENDTSGSQTENNANGTATTSFQVGTWKSESRYFYFYDTTNGSTADLEQGIGLAFTYECNSDGSFTFHMGSATESETATVIFSDSKTATIVWEDGTTETLQFLSEAIQVEENAAASEDSASSENAVSFEAGAWIGADQFYLFSGTSDGQTISYQNGTGLGFTYELNADGSAVFHMGSADSSETATVSFYDNGSSATLTWADGSSETLTYIGYYEADNFVFYTDEQLCQLALSYHEATYGESPSQSGAEHTDGSTLVTIQLYDNVDGHNSTAAWYTIDRLTLMGSDASGTQIDFSTVER